MNNATCSLHLRILFVAMVPAWGLAGPGFAQTVEKPFTPEQREQLKERNRLWQESFQLERNGQLSVAITTVEKVLALERSLLGNLHEDVVSSLERLAYLHERMEEFATAEGFRREVVSVQQKRFGEDHWKVTDARLSVDHVRIVMALSDKKRAELDQSRLLQGEMLGLTRKGKNRDATPLAEKALAIRKEILGDNHPFTARSLDLLGNLLSDQGDYVGARPHLEQAMAIRKKILGDNHPDTVRSINSLANVLSDLGGYLDAGSYSEQASTIRKLTPGKEQFILKETTFINDLAISANGKLLGAATGAVSREGELKLWDLNTGECLHAIKHDNVVSCLAFAPDGHRVASVSIMIPKERGPRTFSVVRIWDTMSGREINTFEWPNVLVHRITFSPDGKTLAVGGQQLGLGSIGAVRLWWTDTGRERATLQGNQTALAMAKASVSSLGFSPDGKQLAVGLQGTTRGAITLVNMDDLTERPFYFEQKAITSLAFFPTGSQLIAAGRGGTIAYFLNLRSMKAFSLKAEGEVVSVAFPADGQTVVMGTKEGNVSFLNLHGKQFVHTLNAHSRSVEHLAVSRDGKILATAGAEHMIKVWPLNLRNASSLFATAPKSGIPKTERSVSDLKALEELFDRAKNLQHRGNVAEAARLFKTIDDLSKKVYGLDGVKRTEVLSWRGVLYDSTGDYAQAESLQREVLRILEKKLGRSNVELASPLHNLGAIYRDTGEYKKSFDHFMRAQDICAKEVQKFLATGQLKGSSPSVLVDGALADLRIGPARRDFLINSIALVETLGLELEDPKLRTLLVRERLPAIKNLIEKNYKLQSDQIFGGRTGSALRAERDDLMLLVARLQGQTDLLSGDFDSAKDSFKRCIELISARSQDPNNVATGSLWLLAGDAESGLGHWKLAEASYQKGLKILRAKLWDEHPLILTGTGKLAFIYRQLNRPDLALAELNKTGERHLRYLKSVLPGMPLNQQLVFLQRNHRFLLQQAMSFGLERMEDPEAVAASAEWILNLKGVALEVLSEQERLLQGGSETPEVKSLVEQLRTIRQNIAYLVAQGPEGSALVKKFYEEEHELANRLGLLVRGKGESEAWLKLDRLRKVLPKNTVLVEVVKVFPMSSKETKGPKLWNSAHYAAWVIPSMETGAVAIVDLGEAEPIDKAVREFRAGIMDRRDPDMTAQLRNLSKLILRPLDSRLLSKPRWLISPDSDLWLLPWETLLLPDGKFVIEKHQVNYLVTGRNLVEPNRKATPTVPVVMANPDYDLSPDERPSSNRKLLPDSQESNPDEVIHPIRSKGLAKMIWGSLPGTAKEAKAILPYLAAYTKKQPRLYVERKALEDVLKAVHSPQVIVLSTHGFVLPDQNYSASRLPSVFHRGLEILDEPLLQKRTDLFAEPLDNPLARCGIVLAGANQRNRTNRAVDDGLLTGLEIVGIDLRGTELVVLSACDTATGKAEMSEGVLGLRYAFQMAGAKKVVATLWKIPDIETAQLMENFFKNLAAGHDTSRALRDAQLTMIEAQRQKKGHANPYYWAGFTVTGP